MAGVETARRGSAADAAPAESAAIAGGLCRSSSLCGSDRYQFCNALGRGSSATVWRAYDKNEKRDVAIKEFADWEGCASQYDREIATLKALNAANAQGNHVLRFLDAFVRENDKPCIVMEFVPGKSLKQILKELRHDKGLALPIISQIASSLLKTLKFLKSNEVSMLHGDLKPDNIMVSGFGEDKKAQVRLIDFGLAFKTSCALRRNMYIQSRWYRSPEVLLGVPATSQIDMWSFGCVLVEMLTGVCPFRGQDSYDQMLLIIDVLGLTSSRLRKNCERSTVEKLDEIEKIVMHRWTLCLNLPPGKCRTAEEVEERLKRKLLQHWPKRNGESESDRKLLVDLIAHILRIDPQERITAEQALRHPFFGNSSYSSGPTVASAGASKTLGERLSQKATETKTVLSSTSIANGRSHVPFIAARCVLTCVHELNLSFCVTSHT